MDIASIIGMLACGFFIVFGIVYGNDISTLIGFWDFNSALITFGGSFMCVFASRSVSEFVKGIKTFALVLKEPKNNTSEMIKKIIELSNVARKEGLLSLEEAAGELEDAFMKKGILLIVDGTDPELVRGIMETELSCIEDRHNSNIAFWENLGAMGPAWGMIGTLIGLINMLKDMSDASSIGPAMAVALVTTFYGSLLANWICSPIATKLKTNSSDEIRTKEVMIEGLLSIQAGENPRIIEEKLKSFLAPNERELNNSDGGEVDG